MATTTATIILSSADLLSNELALSTTATLTQATNSTGLTLTSGLSRTNFTTGGSAPFTGKVIYRSDDALTGGSNKVYLKNLSTTPAQFFTVYIDQEEMGKLYAGDWAFFPWSATQGTLETFVVTVAATWAIGDTWDFDGITTTAANTTVADIAGQIDAQHYPNWTTSITGAAVTFVARNASVNGVVTAADAITGDTVVTNGNGTAAITSGAAGTRSEADITIVPSVATTIDLEHMLFKQ